MSDVGAIFDALKLWLGLIFGAATTALVLRKKVSADGVDIATDGERTKWLKQLIIDRDADRKEISTLRERVAVDAGELGRLRAQVDSQAELLKQCRAQIDRLQGLLDADRRHLAQPHPHSERRNPSQEAP